MEICIKEKPSRAGLTFPELLVVILILLFLVSIFLPTIPHPGAHRRAKMLRLAENGNGIYKQIFAAVTETSGGETNYWAASQPNTEFANYQPTSTDYFRWLMTPYDPENPSVGVEVLAQDFSMFQAPEIPQITRLEDLTKETNPWCMIADLDERSTPGTPFMVTRNLNENRLQTWKEGSKLKLKNVGTGPYTTPYGEESLVVVRVGGGAEILNKKQFFWDTLNPTLATNQILFP